MPCRRSKATGRSCKSVFAPLREVLAVDCMVLRLHNALEPFYPSTFRHYMKASAKVCVVMNVIGRGAKTVTITHGSRHDRHLLQAGPWMKGRLLIFDLGFFRATLFEEISRNGGYFLSRMRKHGNPVIVRSHRRAHRDLVGFELNDAQLIVGAGTAACGHARRAHDSSLRCALGDRAALSRAQKYRIEQTPSVNRHVSETLIYAALLTLVASRALQRALHARWKVDPWRRPLDRWGVLIAAVAEPLLALLISRRDRLFRSACIERFLRAEAEDPNQTRIPLPFRAQMGVYSPG
jgi:hypothetical protein